MHQRIATRVSVASNLASAVSRAAAVWNALSVRWRIGAAGLTGVAAIGLVAWLVGGGRPCGERADVEARVAALSGNLQADAASAKITIVELSSRIKKLNAAATAFESSKDLRAYCEALDQLGEEFVPPEN